MLAALADYVLKAEAVGYFGKGPQLVRFFGLFYSVTGLAAVLIQALARTPRARAAGPRRLGGEPPGRGRSGRSARFCAAVSLARHPSARARRRRAQLNFPRRLRAALHPVDARRRSARPSRSSTSRFDCAGKGAGAVLILVLVQPCAVARVCGAESRRRAGGRGRVPRGAPTPGGIRERARRRAATPGRGPGAGGRVLDGRLHGRQKHGRSRPAAVLRALGSAGPVQTAARAGRSGGRGHHRVPFGRPRADSRCAAATRLAIRSSSALSCRCWRGTTSCA